MSVYSLAKPGAPGLIDTIVYPLMSYGGLNFNGTTTYLDTNALTGIADGKKFTWVGIRRFANAASANEVLFACTSSNFRILRGSTGNITVTAKNSAGTVILNQVTTGLPCAAAGQYIFLISADMGTAGSYRIYINDLKPSVTSTTFTDDTIDFTVTEYAVGADQTGANFFAGDDYEVYFNTATNLDFDTVSVRRKFYDVNLVPVSLGSNGELPTGSRPTLFLGYGNSDTWYENRGSALSTSFVKNGAIADATTVLYGQQVEGVWHTWTPTRTGWTDLGAAPTVTARYSQIGNRVSFQVKVDPDTSTATTAGTSYISLPIAANQLSISGDGSMGNTTTNIAIGSCVFDLVNGRCYVPTQAATANNLVIAGWYEA